MSVRSLRGASGRFGDEPSQFAGLLAGSRGKHAVHQHEAVVLRKEPFSSPVEEDRMAFAVDNEDGF